MNQTDKQEAVVGKIGMQHGTKQIHFSARDVSEVGDMVCVCGVIGFRERQQGSMHLRNKHLIG